ncbi:Signaling mucin MSB2 [Beauveria bassiana]|nr:Signaling mucin MSB2 [Beauveria bassiana]
MAAYHLREAAPRSAGGLLFPNTTQATLPPSTESASPTNVEIISSAAGGNPAIQPTTSRDPTTMPITLGSSSTAATAPRNPSDLAIVQASPTSSSVHRVEPTDSDQLTVVRVSPGLTSNHAVEPTNSGDLTLMQGSSSSSSTYATKPPNSVQLTVVRGSPGLTSNPAVEPTNSGDLTVVRGGPNPGSNSAAGPTPSKNLALAPPALSLSSNSVAEPAASTGVTTASYRSSSIHPGSVDKTGPASTTTHKSEPSRPTTSAEISSTLPTKPPTHPLEPTSVYSALPNTLRQSSTDAPGSTWTPTLTSALSRTAHGTATQEAMSASRQDRASGSVGISLPPLTTTTVPLPATASKPQTAMHAVAIDASTTVDGIPLTATSLAPSRDGVPVNTAENLITVGGTAASQTIQSSFTSRTSTASAVTLSRGGTTATTILTEAPSPTRDGPSGRLQTPVQGLPRVILPGSSITSSDGSLIQLGFLFPLNYVFVSQHLQAAAQIFEVLPGALAHGTVQRSAVEVARLVPYDTRARVGYITTIAKLYYPKAFVDQLQTDILQPKSDIYTGGGDMQRNLTALIDPAIRITDDDGGMDCASQTCAAPSPGTPNSSKQTGITAGAVVGGAAFCGALGLGVFQLYRRRGSAAWPFGKRKSGRLDGSRISRPMNSVNSLGWNWLMTE